jgi:hypothetical protein
MLCHGTEEIAAGLVAAAILLGAAHPAVAQERRPVRTRYEAPPSCPGERAFIDELRGRTKLAVEAAEGEEATTFIVTLTEQEGGFAGTLIIETDDRSSRRELDGETCPEVVAAMALIAALAIDPLAETSPAPPPASPASPASPEGPLVEPTGPSPQPAPPVEPASEPQPASAPQPASEPPTGPPLPRPPADRPSPAEAPGDTGAHRRWGFGARGQARAGPAPSALFGAELLAELRSERPSGWSVRVDASAGATGEISVDPAAASFVLATGRLSGCPLGWRPHPTVDVRPCGLVEAGLLWAEGSAGGPIIDAQSVSEPWLAPGVTGRLAWEPIAWLFVEAEAGPVVPIIRRTFVFEQPDMELHEVPPVTLSIGLGLGFRP